MLLKQPSRRILLFACIGAVPLLLFGSYLYFVICVTPNWRANLGTFGDSFGLLNTLFTGLTFAGLLITIIQQREEIENQRSELLQSRTQFERSATAQETTAKLNAYSELLAEYTLQARKLEERIASLKNQRQKELMSSSTHQRMLAAVEPSPWDDELLKLNEKRNGIIKKLEAFLEAPTTQEIDES